jgi:hypothetical protein
LTKNQESFGILRAYTNLTRGFMEKPKSNSKSMDEASLEELEQIVKDPYPLFQAREDFHRERTEMMDKQEVYRDEHPGSTNQYRHRLSGTRWQEDPAEELVLVDPESSDFEEVLERIKQEEQEK